MVFARAGEDEQEGEEEEKSEGKKASTAASLDRRTQAEETTELWRFVHSCLKERQSTVSFLHLPPFSSSSSSSASSPQLAGTTRHSY
jgi:hypothetical protein